MPEEKNTNHDVKNSESNIRSNDKSLLQKKLIKQSIKKIPELAAFLGVLFPPIGFLYVRKPIRALLALLLGITLILLTTVGIGIPMLFFYEIICSFLCFKAAEQINVMELRIALEKEWLSQTTR